MKKIGVFPGSFDPFTVGHEAVVRKSAKLFDEVIIALGENNSKQYMFTTSSRIKQIEKIFENDDRISVQQFSGLTVDFCKANNAEYIIRGLRDSKDYGFEQPIAHMNKQMAGIETIFFITDQKYSAINASIVREIYKNDGDITDFVSELNELEKTAQ